MKNRDLRKEVVYDVMHITKPLATLDRFIMGQVKYDVYEHLSRNIRYKVMIMTSTFRSMDGN